MRAKQLSPVELTREMLDRIGRLNPSLGAYYTIFADQALAEASSAESEIAGGRWRGPLHGVPIAFKDLYELGPTTAGSKLLAGHFPPARNPWDPDRTPGGSSTGAGTALAAGMAFGAFGTDTGGSVRLPAAYCGVVGYKPTFGLLSRSGVIPLSPSLDHTGPLARTVADAAALAEAVRGHDPADPGSSVGEVGLLSGDLDAGVRGLHVGVPRDLWDGSCDPAVAELVNAALARLSDLGAEVEEVRVGVSLLQVMAVGY